jgi:hypothetical protein
VLEMKDTPNTMLIYQVNKVSHSCYAISIMKKMQC